MPPTPKPKGKQVEDKSLAKLKEEVYDLYTSIKCEEPRAAIMALPADLRCINELMRLIDTELDRSAPKQDMMDKAEPKQDIMKETERLRQEMMGNDS
jgi:hypothetical protein